MTSSRSIGVVLALACGAPAAATPSFTGLGDVAGGVFNSRANAISGDGQWVVGNATGASGPVAFRWSLATGLEEIGPGTANGVSDDGSVVVGGSQFGSGPEAYRWTAAGGMAPLGDLPGGGFRSQANAVSADGSIVVGRGDSGRTEGSRVATGEAFRWDAQNGMVSIVAPVVDHTFGDFFSGARAISASGDVVTGGSTIRHGDTPFAWTAGTGTRTLDDLSRCTDFCEEGGWGVSPDGSLLLGGYYSSEGYEEPPYVWNLVTDAIQYLPTEHAFGQGLALDASNGGAVLVGFQNELDLSELAEDLQGTGAAIWQGLDYRILQFMLTDDFGLDLSGWVLTAATAVSYDGKTIVGYGINPDGNPEAWIAQIPEPGTAWLVAGGLLALAMDEAASELRIADRAVRRVDEALTA